MNCYPDIYGKNRFIRYHNNYYPGCCNQRHRHQRSFRKLHRPALITQPATREVKLRLFILNGKCPELLPPLVRRIMAFASLSVMAVIAA
jgi:hypothetical protein